MTFEGMDPDVVHGLGTQLKNQDQAIPSIVASIDGIITQIEGSWKRSVATEFIGWWQRRPSAHPTPSSEDVGPLYQIVDGDVTVYDPPASGKETGTLGDGTDVSVLCITQADSIDIDTLWDKIAEPAGYVNDSSVSTNDSAGIPSC